METWRNIEGFGGFYEVSDQGRVRSYRKRGDRTGTRTETPTIMVGVPLHGYPSVVLTHGRQRREGWRIHLLVLRTFVGPPPPGHICRHLNGDPSDARLVNLVWGTPQQNSDDKYAHGTMVRGAATKTARLSAEDVVAIRALLARGHGLGWLADLFGVDKATIVRIRDMETWKHLRVFDR